MYSEYAHLRDYLDSVAARDRSRRRQWSRPPRPPSPVRQVLASGLRAAADAMAPAPGAGPRSA